MLMKDGEVKGYTYDTLDRIKSVSFTKGNIIGYLPETYTYDSYGNLEQKVIGGQVSHTYTYKYADTASRAAESRRNRESEYDSIRKRLFGTAKREDDL